MERLTVFIVAIFAICLQNGLAQKDFSYSDFKDFLQIGGDVKIIETSHARSGKNLGKSFEDGVNEFLKSNDLLMEVPFGQTVTFSGRNLDNGEVDFKLRLGSGNAVEGRKKSKVKKVLAPILIILLLKAITLIPLALGILGIKTWNALQLSFFSFVTSVVLAVWKICSKFSDHHHAPHVVHESVHIPHAYHDSHHVVHHDHHDHDHHDHHIVHHEHDDHHHDPWDHHYHRSDDSSQQLAYNGYVPENRM
ncbi:unnamed protein product [Ceutorhynchus assimilis]|uniref:Uncharacterized protein n=1 Tax=Ceutorhynchus assimilis TaxID=467358 RepID=A0A9N9MAF2_9CUCU|nr:unnamed protein product [Ceutorhynchus assimilis]